MMLPFSCGGFKVRSDMAAPNRSIYAPMLIVIILCLGVIISCEETDRLQCEKVVKEWASKEQEASNRAEKSNETSKSSIQQLLFFLHIPRTGGRNYNYCFLRTLFPEDSWCPPSYALRFDPRQICNLLSTHDDYSVVSKLPKEKTSVVTNMRHPVQRFVGAYEFSVEVSARFLKRPRSVLARKSKLRSNITSTLDIWPWKYLVPWMRNDLFDRRDARLLEELVTPLNFSSVYDVPSHVMPLHEFINHPLAQDLLHNGATFQVAGITNNSILPNAESIRKCANLYQDLGHHVLVIAKKRLDTMLFVGLTENQRRSAEVLAAILGKHNFQKSNGSLLSTKEETFEGGAPMPHHKFSSNHEGSLLSTKEETSEGVPMADHKSPLEHEDVFNTSRGLKPKDSLHVRYQKCSTSLRKVQSLRRKVSLETVSPVNFTKQTRESIPQAVLVDILKLNNLDAELYEHAQKLFEEQESLLRTEPKAMSRMVLDWMVDETEAASQQQHFRSFLNALNVSSVLCVLLALTCSVMFGRFHLQILKILRMEPFRTRGRKIFANNNHRRQF
ncbi:hypothetical protein O6H91_Y447900 [Diphasiastrum complanatum]|nr:hypothetical protein O6H91_Y447900 [Diphasiastrum complanatum]